MAFAILRTRKMKTAGQMAGMQKHNSRTNNVWNADPELTKFNSTFSKYGSKDLKQDIETHIERKGAIVKSNSVKAIEHLITFSPEFSRLEKQVVEEEGKDREVILRGNAREIKAYFNDAKKWLEERYGADNVVHISTHYDERTPHIHAYVVPCQEKVVKWKNQTGHGERKSVTLNAKGYLGGKEMMQEMQDSFHEAVKHHGLERGIKGSLAKHEDIQNYYARVNQSADIEREIKSFELGKSDFELVN